MPQTLTLGVHYDELDLAEADYEYAAREAARAELEELTELEEEADFERHIEGVLEKTADEIAQEVPFANHPRVFLDARSDAWAFLAEHDREASFDHRRELAFPADTLYTARWAARFAARRTAIRLGLLIDLKPKLARSFDRLATSLRPRRSARSVRPAGRRSSGRARARSPGSSDDPSEPDRLAAARGPA
jgi:hypothetical protein